MNSCDIPFFGKFNNTIHMMDTTVIKNENTARTRVRIHDFKKLLKPCQELVAVVASLLDLAVYDAVNSQSGENRVSV